MLLGYENLNKLARQYGDSYYLYFPNEIEKNYHKIMEAFSNYPQSVQIAYAYKANYLPRICQQIDVLGGYAEICNSIEYAIAQKLGIPESRMVLNGPAKEGNIVSNILKKGGIVNIDSLEELEEIRELAIMNREIVFRIGIRCKLECEKGQASRFGIEMQESVMKKIANVLNQYRNIHVVCLHCHVKGRGNKPWREKVSEMVEIYRRLYQKYRITPEYLNFGGSLPILDECRLFEVAEEVVRICTMNLKEMPFPKLMLEPGAEIASSSMQLVSKVKRVKKWKNRSIAIVNASSFQVNPLHRNGEVACYVCSLEKRDGSEVPYDIAGNTCLEDDYFCRDFMRHIYVGDYVIFQNVGAYALTFKPPFGEPNVPVLECLKDGQIAEIKRAEKVDEHLETFLFIQ